MLLPFDLRADREGWTVFEIATDRPAFLEEVPLSGLCLADAEDAVNALNKLEIACRRTARMMMDPRVLSGAQPDFGLNQSRGGRQSECAGVGQPSGGPTIASGVRDGGTQLSRNIARLVSAAAP
jgi:hypothetical protein